MYDAFGDRMADSYELFLFALKGRYQQMRAPGIEVTPRAVTDLMKDAAELAQTFYKTATDDIDAYASSLNSNASGELLVDRKLKAEADVRGLIADNLSQISKMSRSGILNVASMMMGSAGAIGLLAQREAGNVNFVGLDTSGRRWPALQLMLVTMRDFAYQSYVDSEIQGYAEQGIDLIELSDGRVVSTMATEGHLSLMDARNAIFHINSNMTMKPYVQA